MEVEPVCKTVCYGEAGWPIWASGFPPCAKPFDEHLRATSQTFIFIILTRKPLQHGFLSDGQLHGNSS